jgi:hypothetical protein
MSPDLIMTKSSIIFMLLKSVPKMIIMLANNLLVGYDLGFIQTTTPLVSFLFVLIGLAVLMKWAANADAFELKYEDMFTTVLPGLPLLLFLVWMGYAYQWKSSWIE